MSATGNDGVPTSQSFTSFWMAGPESPATPIVGNPVANPVTDLGTLAPGDIIPSTAAIQQANLTTMSNAVPQDEFGQHTPNNGMTDQQNASVAASVQGHVDQMNEHTLVSVVNANDGLMGNCHPHQMHIIGPNTTDHQHHQIQHHHHHPHNIHIHPHNEQKYFPVNIHKTENNIIDNGTILISPSHPNIVVSQIPNSTTLTITGVGANELSHVTQQPQPARPNNNKKKPRNVNCDLSNKPTQRRRLSSQHRESIIDLVFNDHKTSREVARYMNLPQSTVMSVVKVFKLEHRIHKKTATGRKRRLTTEQEMMLYEMSMERDNISVDEIRGRFLRIHPEFEHISKTTIYRTIERGKKNLIGKEPGMRVAETAGKSQPTKRKVNSKQKVPTNPPPVSQSTPQLPPTDTLSMEPFTFKTPHNTTSMTVAGPSTSNGLMAFPVGVAEPSVIINENVEEGTKQRRSLSISEREMIISLFFNESRSIREIADFMKLAKSTVSSVVQVFKKEHRIQRKTSTGRKKKLSEVHHSTIIDILSQKDDITIEETRNKFLALNPEVTSISKSTIYRVMENYQNKLKSRSDISVFVGTLVTATEAEPMVVMKQKAMGVVNEEIVFVDNAQDLDRLKTEFSFSDSNITYLTENQFLMPGLIDTHIHASQFSNNGLAMGLPLLEWLQTYTFPTEAKFSDLDFAGDVYKTVVSRLIRNGTTTASYYATIHLDSSKLLAEIVKNKGQRALVGKVNMTRNCPEYYREHSVQQSLHDTEDFVRYVRDLQSPLVQPVITPRFAPTSTEEQLLGLGQLAHSMDCHIQTHLCETKPECNWVRELFPWAKSYTDVYDRMRLLNDKTIVAHCVHSSPPEISLLSQKGTGVSHCPNSNTSLKSGSCDVRAFLNAGVKVGLGTDCSGGFSSSMLDAIRRAVEVSKLIYCDRENRQEQYRPLSHKEAFRLATLGGAEVLSMQHKIGSFSVSKEFDALLVDVKVTNSPLDIFQHDNIEAKVDKFLFNGDDRNIVKVFVAGKQILDNTSAVNGQD